MSRPDLFKPVARLADGLRSLTGWRRYGAAILAGMIMALSLPPADILPALWLGIPAFAWLLEGVRTRRGAFLVGWSFGFGYLAISLYWITFSLFVAIDRYWWLVPFASNVLAAGLAIYSGLAGVGIVLVPRNRPVARSLVLAAMVCLCEWLRGHLLTGFPWNLSGYAWTEFPWLIQSAALIGIYGVTLLAVLAPALAAPLGSRFASRRTAGLAALAGLAIMAAATIGGAIRLPSAPVATVPDVRLRLVQPAIKQSLKWVPGLFEQNLQRHIELSLAPAAAQPTAIIWPEAAEPFLLDGQPDYARTLAQRLRLQPGQLLITGIGRDFPDADPPSFRDSIEVLSPAGDIIATYDKFHYVPFGEYMPLRRWLPVDSVAVSGIDPDPGPGPRTIRLPGLPPAGPLICYEVIFPHDVVDEADRPDWLLDVTNDAWFGLTAGPHQHFAMMRVRAVEEGLPLVNAANDGISGVIDPYGRVLASLDLGAVGFLDAALPRPLPQTPYAGLGDLPFFALSGLLILAAAALCRGLGTRRGPIAQPRPL
jgi:apolipoprotein N-acyltransferase